MMSNKAVQSYPSTLGWFGLIHVMLILICDECSIIQLFVF